MNKFRPFAFLVALLASFGFVQSAHAVASQKTRAALTTQATACVYQNSIKAITGACLQDTLNSMILSFDSLLDIDLTSYIVRFEQYATVQLAANAAFGKTLFIPDNTDLTITVGPGAEQFATIQTAITAAQHWEFGANSTLTILVTCGTYNYGTSPIVFNHPYGDHIGLRANCSLASRSYSVQTPGEAVTVVDVPVAGAQLRQSHLLTFNLTSVTGLSIGDYLKVTNIVGTGEFRAMLCFCKITNIVGNAVTLESLDIRAAFGATTLTSANIVKPPVTINFTLAGLGNDNYGLSVAAGTKLGGFIPSRYFSGIDGFALIGNGSSTVIATAGTDGIGVLDGAQILIDSGQAGASTFGVVTAQWGRHGMYVFRLSQVTGTGFMSYGNATSGVAVTLGGEMDLTNAYFGGNALSGASSNDGGIANVIGSNSIGNGYGYYANNGIMLAGGTAASASLGYAWYNGTGLYCTFSSSCYADGGHFQNNGTGIQSRYGHSAVSAAAATVSTNSFNYIPALNTTGAEGEIITDNTATSFTVSGATIGASTLTGTSVFTGFTRVTGTVPTATACGASPAITGTDSAGSVTPGAGATGCTINFIAGHAPVFCNVDSEGAAGAPIAISYVKSTNNIVVTSSAAIVGTVIDWRCSGG